MPYTSIFETYSWWRLISGYLGAHHDHADLTWERPHVSLREIDDDDSRYMHVYWNPTAVISRSE
jgi:hypothetical protein